MKNLHPKPLAINTLKVALGSVLFSVLLYLLSCTAPPPGYYRPPVPASIDRILDDLGLANIAFNAPAALRLRQRAGIQLLLFTKESIEELQQKLVETGQKEGAAIKISDQMDRHRRTRSGAGLCTFPPTGKLTGTTLTERSPPVGGRLNRYTSMFDPYCLTGIPCPPCMLSPCWLSGHFFPFSLKLILTAST
jgi:hypothetical protein